MNFEEINNFFENELYKYANIIEDFKPLELLFIEFPNILNNEINTENNSNSEEFNEHLESNIIKIKNCFERTKKCFTDISKIIIKIPDSEIELFSYTLSNILNYLEMYFKACSTLIIQHLTLYILNKQIGKDRIKKLKYEYKQCKSDIQDLSKQIKDYMVKNNLYIYKYRFINSANKMLVEENKLMKKQIYL